MRTRLVIVTCLLIAHVLVEGSFFSNTCHSDRRSLAKSLRRQPLKHALVIMRDMGLRPDEVFRMRLEEVHWDTRLYFNPYGKSRKARRWIPMSQRVIEALKARAERNSECVFPSQKAA